MGTFVANVHSLSEQLTVYVDKEKVLSAISHLLGRVLEEVEPHHLVQVSARVTTCLNDDGRISGDDVKSFRLRIEHNGRGIEQVRLPFT
jgi:hypothetical protein